MTGAHGYYIENSHLLVPMDIRLQPKIIPLHSWGVILPLRWGGLHSEEFERGLDQLIKDCIATFPRGLKDLTVL